MAITRLRSLLRRHGDLGALLVLLCLPLLLVAIPIRRVWRRRFPHHIPTKRRFLPAAFGLLIAAGAAALSIGSHLAAVAPRCSSVASPGYDIADLGTLPDGGGSYALALNDRGQVVGTADTNHRDEHGDHIYHAFLWQNGVLQDLGTLGACSRAVSINARGQIVGTSWISPSQCFAFLWDNGRMRSLGSLGGRHTGSWGGGINGAGQAVGATSMDGRSGWYPFVWQNGQMQPLDPVCSCGAGEAIAINDIGDVIGVTFEDRAIVGYLLQRGRLVNIPRIGGDMVWPTALNGRGQVVGMAEYDHTEKVHGFLWNAQMSKPQELETLGGKQSYAAGINDLGDIVGEAESSAAAFRAALWRGGTVTDLNAMLPAGSGWVLYYATAINNSGMIVGVGKHDGKTRGFLLTPR